MGFVASAQNISKDNVYLYFTDAYNQAKTDNLTIRAYEHEQKMFVLNKKSASGLRSPQFTLMANYSLLSSPVEIDMNGLKNSIGEIGGLLPDAIQPMLKPIFDKINATSFDMVLQENNFGLLGVSMVAPIYMGGKINAANNAAKIRISQGENKREKNLSSLCSELSERYFGLSLAKEVSVVRQEVVDGMHQHYNSAVALEKNGIIAKGDRLYAEMFLNKSKAEYQKSIRDIVSINTALENTLNAKANYQPLTSMFILTSIESVGYFVNYAMDNSPLLKDVDFKKQLAKEDVRAKRAEILPTVSATGVANIVDYNLTDVAPRAMIGISVNYKLFNGVKNINDLKSSKETVKMVELLEGQARLDVATLIEKSYNDLLSLVEQVESYNSTINFSKEYLRVKVKSFSEGVSSSSDVVDAQLELAKAKIEKLELVYKYDVALAKLLELCGMSHLYEYYMAGNTSKSMSF